MRAWRALLAFALLAAVAGMAGRAIGASAPGRLVGKVSISRGGKAQPVPSGSVVVYLVGFKEDPPSTVPEMRQKGKAFEPPLLVITAGQTISFPNYDKLFHNVFSLSPTRKFDLGSYKKGESKTKDFPDPGIIDVYCNIHPKMAGTILVLPNRRFAKVASDGTFKIDGIPAGTWDAFAYDRFAEKPARARVTIPGGGEAKVEFSIDETRTDFTHKNKYGEEYRGDGGGYR